MSERRQIVEKINNLDSYCQKNKAKIVPVTREFIADIKRLIADLSYTRDEQVNRLYLKNIIWFKPTTLAKEILANQSPEYYKETENGYISMTLFDFCRIFGDQCQDGNKLIAVDNDLYIRKPFYA